jgi:aspartyl-tRNA(Asn)/glutamyl-tRNA(Gln) amidotransferase subunit A
VLIGKNGLHELAMGLSNDNPHFGRPVNPWDRACSPGGSSGGSAVAVVLGIGVGSVGTDTGGSIRVPAASCGVFGLKPTKGYVSTEGVTGVSWTLDHVGPLAARVEDIDAMLRAMVANPDPALDPSARADLRGKRLGVPRTYFSERLEPQVSEAYAAAKASFERLGATLVEIDMPPLGDIVELAFIVSKVEGAHNNREWFRKHPEQVGKDIRDHLTSAAEIPASDYLKWMERQSTFGQEIQTLFNEVDAIIVPTLPATAKPYGIQVNAFDRNTESYPWSMIRNTCIFNTSGHPALTMPFPITSGLPVGIQIVGPWRSEATLLSFAKAYQDAELQGYFAHLAKLRQSVSSYHV